MDLKISEKPTIFKYDTEYSADSVEWCPHEPFQTIFACANYQLKENEKSSSETTNRVGRILLFQITPDSGLKLLQQIETNAILDQKWCPNKIANAALLGVVDAKSYLYVYKLNECDLKLELVDKIALQLSELNTSETLLLSLDWSTGKYASQEPQIITSDSKGNLNLFGYANGKITLVRSWKGHDYEAWISAFYYWDANIIFSGGDDSILLKFDQRVGDVPIAKNRSHEAGVTSIHSNKSKENIIATGSYDEHVRLWDVRKLKQPLNALKMPGPLWRLKWDVNFSQEYLLAACMLGGVHIIKAGEQMELIASYTEHQNIAYGADWSFCDQEQVSLFSKDDDYNVIIGTCSFYDHLLCVSKFKI